MDETVVATGTWSWPGLTFSAQNALAARYELLGEIGQGGMGVVYRARHRTLARPVALKVMRPGGSAERFLREARLLAQIRSPHVVAVHDCEILPDGFPALAMEWMEGGTLQDVLERQPGPLSEDEVRPWMLQVAQGMRAAEELGIVHRDLKPSNVLLDNQKRAGVADFGLARTSQAPGDVTLEHPGVMGTPFYMAPEQAEDPRGVDVRADVYSFGATFFHLLTGAPPFDGPSVFAILFRHKTEPLIPPRTLNPRLSQHLGEVLERCLAKSPNDRFGSFAELVRQLDPTPKELSPWHASDDEGITSSLARYQQRREFYLTRRGELDTPDVYEFGEGRRLVILRGSLAEQQVDALVSSEDGHLTMGTTSKNPTGVAASLLRAAGPGLFEEARRFVPVRPGRVVVTSAGSLAARYVFHGITLEGARERRVCPSRDLISEILASCFYHADTLYVTTVAFPLLGTGSGGFAQDVCLDTMFRFLARMLRRGLTTVREARIVLYHRDSPVSVHEGSRRAEQLG